jgi:hypothetical protein
MNDKDLPNLEDLWDRLLSRQPQQVRAAFKRLSTAEQKTVRDHLQRMASEPGWHPEQQRSAQAALEALDAPQG